MSIIGHQIIARFKAIGRTWLISLIKTKSTWLAGFTDEEALTDLPTGLAGTGAFEVFQRFIQALIYLLDKYNVDCWSFGGDLSRQNLYNRLLERALRINPELSKKWELVEHKETDHPYAVGERVAFWGVCRKD